MDDRFPQNCPFLWGDRNYHLIYDSLGQSELIIQRASRSVQAVFAQVATDCPSTLQWAPIYALPRRETSWNLVGCPKLTKRSQDASRLKFTILWGHVEEISRLNKFFPIVDTCHSWEYIARQSCAMVPRWGFFASCIFSELRAVHFRPAF